MKELDIYMKKTDLNMRDVKEEQIIRMEGLLIC